MENLKVLNKSNLNLSVVVHSPRYPVSSPLVLLLHGFTGYKGEAHIESLAELLAKNGFFAVRFDCSGSGASDGTIENDYRFSNYLSDIGLVLDFVKTLPNVDKNRIGIWGHSMGGQLACIFASTHPEIKSLCAISPPSIFILPDSDMEQMKKSGFFEKESPVLGKIKIPAAFFDDRVKYDASKAVRNLLIPKLIIWGTNDTICPAERTKLIFDSAAKPKKRIIFEEMGHDYKNYPILLEKVNEEVLNFFGETLLSKETLAVQIAPTTTQTPKPLEKIALAYSVQDPAGMLIAEKIKEIGVPKWAVMYELDRDIVFIDPAKIKENKIIFLSRHKSETGTKSLTVHMIGNFDDAKFGGRTRELAGALPQIGANYLRVLNEKNISSTLSKQGFVVSLEVTHHGPMTQKKCVFIELGSAPIDWKNETAAKLIAETVIEATMKETKDKIAIGFGGGHYAPDFTKLSLRKNYAFGHICPKHQLHNLNKALIQQMIERSGASEIVLDWKGLKENKERVLELCKRTMLPIERVQNLLK